MRALRVLLACLVLMLPAAPARSAPVVPDTVVLVAYAVTAAQVVAKNAEAPRGEIAIAPAKAASFVQAEAFSPTAPVAGFELAPADRWLLYCALLC